MLYTLRVGGEAAGVGVSMMWKRETINGGALVAPPFIIFSMVNNACVRSYAFDAPPFAPPPP